VKRVSRFGTNACDLATDLSTAGFAEEGVLVFSVPLGGWVGPREAVGVDLSEGAGAVSVFFLSPAGCAGTGVEGRGESAAPFCYG
jgi:hypothetical protein